MTSESVQKGGGDGEKHKCNLCNLCYSSEKDLTEHQWSLIHHSEMEKKSPMSLSHSCSLCQVTVPSIKEYRSHLNDEKHKKAVERSRSGEAPVDSASDAPKKPSLSGKKKNLKNSSSRKRDTDSRISQHQDHFHARRGPGYGGEYDYQGGGPGTGAFDRDYAACGMHEGIPNFPNNDGFPGFPGNLANGTVHSSWQDPPTPGRPANMFYSMENENWNNTDWGERAREWRYRNDQAPPPENQGWGHNFRFGDQADVGFQGVYASPYPPPEDLYWDFSRSYPGARMRETEREQDQIRRPSRWDQPSEDLVDFGHRKRQRDYDEEMSSSKSYKMADSSSDFHQYVRGSSSLRMNRGDSSTGDMLMRVDEPSNSRDFISGGMHGNPGLPKSRLTAARSTESLDTPWSRGPNSKSMENSHLSIPSGPLGSGAKPSSVTQKKSSALAIKQKYLGGKTGSKSSLQQKGSKSLSLHSPRDHSDNSGESHSSSIVAEAARRVKNLRDQRMQANAQQREKARKQVLTTEIDKQLEVLATNRQSRISGALEKGSCSSTSMELDSARSMPSGHSKSPAASLRVGPSSGRPQIQLAGNGSAVSDSEGGSGLKRLARSNSERSRSRQSDIERIRQSIENPSAPLGRRHSSENNLADSVDSSEGSPQVSRPLLPPQHRSSRNRLSRDQVLKMVNAPRSRRDQRHLALLMNQLGNQQTLPASRISTLDDKEMVPDFTMGDLEVDENMDTGSINCEDLPVDFQRKINQLLEGSGSPVLAGLGEGQSSMETQPDSSCLPSQSQPRPDSALQLSDLASSLARPQASPSHAPEPSSTNSVRNSSTTLSPQPSQPPVLPDTATVDPDSAGPSRSSFLQDCGIVASPPRPSSTSTLGGPGSSLPGSSLQSATVSASAARPQAAGLGLLGSRFSTETGGRPGVGDFRVPSLDWHHLKAPFNSFGTGSGESMGLGAGSAGMLQQSSEVESSLTSMQGSSSGEGSNILEQMLAFSEQEEKLQVEVERAEARVQTLIGALQQTVAHHSRLVQSQRTLQRERMSLLRASDSQRSSQMSSSSTLESRLQRLPQTVRESGRGAGSSTSGGSRSANPASEDLTLEDLGSAGRDSWTEEAMRPSSTSLLQAPPQPPSPAPPPGPYHPLPPADADSGGQVDFVKREPNSPPRVSSSPGLSPSLSHPLSSSTPPSMVSSTLTATSVTAAPQPSTFVSSGQRRESSELTVLGDRSRPQVIMSRPYSVVLDHRSAGFSSPIAMLDSTATYIGSITPFDDIRGQLQKHLSKLPQGFSFDESEVKREIQDMLHLNTRQQGLVSSGFMRQNSESTSASVPTDGEGQGTESHQDRITPRGSDCSLGERIRKMCQSVDEPIEVCNSDSDNTLVRDNSFEVDEAVSRSLRECSVVLEKLPLCSGLQSRVVNSSTRDSRKCEDGHQDVKEEGASGQYELTAGSPMSPGQRRRLTRKERNRLSRRRKHELLPTTSEESSHDDEAGRSASPRQRLQFQARSPVSDSEEDVTLEDNHTQSQRGMRPAETSATLPPTGPSRRGSESPEDRKPVLASSTSSIKPALDNSQESADESYVVQGTTPSGVESFVGPKARVACTLIHKDDLYVCYFGIQKPCRFHIENSSARVLYECGCLSMQCMALVTQQGREDRLFVGGDSRYLLAFNINSASRIQELILGGRITCLHADGDFLYAGLDTGNVEVMNLKMNKKTETFRCSETALTCIQSGQEGGSRLLCVGNQSGTIAVVDAQNGLLVRELVGHSKSPVAIQVAKHQVYSGGMDKLVMVHNLHNGNLEKTYANSQGVVKAVVLDDDDMLYVGGFDGLVRCYKNGELLWMYYGAETAGILTISLHKGKLYTGNSMGVVQSIRLKLSEKWACRCSNCDYVFGYREHLKFHIFRDHILLKARLMRCPWRDCQMWITASEGEPAISIAQKVDEHMSKHLAECKSD